MSNSQIRYFDKFLCGILPGLDYDITDKSRGMSQYVSYMLNRTQSMFRWNNLPDTIPQRVLELYLQTNGNVCFYEYNNELYVFTGGLGGEPNVYYMPTIYTVANPALNLFKTLKIDEECIVVPNDALYIGLLPLFKRYAVQMVETDISINIAAINSRIIDIIAAPDDRTKESAQAFLDNIKAGKLSVIGENSFLDGIRALPYAGRDDSLTNLIELMQYEKASLFNEIGLNANYNMKRESLNSVESQLNDDALLPLIDDMLKQRQIGAEKVNAMFGTNITVELASSWEDNEEELELEHEAIAQESTEENVEEITEEVEDVPEENGTEEIN